MPSNEYLVVGSGLAGALLANELLLRGKKVLIFDNPLQASSSSVAGGMFNPVTGKYLTKTWMDENLFTSLFPFYRALEAELNLLFLHETGIFRPFSNLENKQHFIAQIEKNSLDNYLQIVEDTSFLYPTISTPMGGLLTKKAGWLDVPLLLEGLFKKFKNLEIYHSEIFAHQALQIEANRLIYKDKTFKNVVFCEGFYGKDNLFFNWLPFNPVKGETLRGEIDNYKITTIVNQGKWLIPLGGNQVRLGATYSWHSLDQTITDVARQELLAGFRKLSTQEMLIQSQQAGVRPSTKDRRPFLGQHPKHQNIFIFNGLGTKGVSIAPFFVKEMADFLISKKEINAETTIARHFSLYS
jgi:glycine/D-amino acid oxidase-like deaminating enzyme